MRGDLDQLNEAAGRYQDIAARVDVDQYEVPLNAMTEAARVEEAYQAGHAYHPQFEFRPVPEASIEELTVFQRDLDRLDGPWIDLLKQTVQYMTRTLVDAGRRDAQAATDRTSAVFGPVSEETVRRAVTELAAPYAPPAEPDAFGAPDLAEVFRDGLTRVGLDGWTILVEPRMNAMMDVSGEHHRVRIRTGTSFSRTMVSRLLVHEIGCHVFRSASGQRQPLQLAGFGLGNYVATEEGLAGYLEDLSGLLDAADSRRFALRYLAAARSLTSGYADVYGELRQYADAAQSFETSTRAKRGIADTSQPGAHLKDKVYFEGVQAVGRHLAAHPTDMDLLYTGKVALDMLPVVREALETGDLVPGAFTFEHIPLLLGALPEA